MGLGHMLDGHSGFGRKLPGLLTNPIPQGLGKACVVKDPYLMRVKKACHSRVPVMMIRS